MKILIVDDHAGFRLIARRLLAEAGFDVVGEAEDGQSGIDAATRLRPEVVLLDVQLPDLDGFRVAEALSRSSTPPAVVLVSNWERHDYGDRAVSAPIQGFIQKSRLTGDEINAVLC